MLKIIKKQLFFHRLVSFAKSLSIASTPIILAGCFVLLLHKTGWVSAPERITVPIVLSLSVLLWIPFYVKMRGSLLTIARRADTLLDSKGIITAGADIFSSGKPQSTWARLIEQRGEKLLASRKTNRIVPKRRFAFFVLPIAAAVFFVLTYNYTRIGAEIKKVEWDEKDSLAKKMHIFNAVDEKQLMKIHEKLKKDFGKSKTKYDDAKLQNLKNEITKALSSFPNNDEEMSEYMKKIEQLKKQIKEIEKSNQKETEILQDIGKKMDGKLLEELGEKLEGKNLEEAAKTAEKIAEELEKSTPSSKKMEEASEDLKEGVEEGEKKLGEEGQKGDESKMEEGSQKEGESGSEAGEKEKSGDEKSGGKEGEGMDQEKFNKLKKALEKLNKLAKMFNIPSMDKIPESLKDLAKEFSDMDLNNEQAKELKDMINKLDNLKNMMVEAKDGKGKGKYSDLRKEFEKEASGGKEGQPGQKGKGQPGAVPEGKPMMPGEGKGEGEQSMESPGGMTPGGKGKKGSEQPGDAPAMKDKPGSDKKGQEGWGDGSAPHLGDPLATDSDATYDDMDVEAKDSPGPLKKDVIKGAAEDGFIGKDYKKIYEDYSSIIDEILEEENVPSLYRYYVNKYFELIAPRE